MIGPRLRPLSLWGAIAIVAGAIWGPVQAATPEEQQQRDLYLQRALRSAAPDPSLVGRTERGSGTGFFVAAHLVLTNYHVIRDCEALTIEPGVDEHQTVLVQAAGTDQTRDLALLKSSLVAPAIAPLEARLERADMSDLFIVGYPLQGMVLLQPSLTPAKARAGVLGSSEPLFQLFAELHPGQSGSPVLDEYGAVVGIIARKIDTVATYQKSGRLVDQIGLAIPAGIALDFLKQHHVPYSLASPPESQSAPERLERARAFVARVSCWR